MITDVSPSQQAVLGLLGKKLFGQEYVLPENIDMPMLIRECRLHTVNVLSDLNISDPQLTQKIYALILNNNRVFSDHTELHRLMTENGIPYVILKGAASAHYYPDPLLRVMGDVDFLVRSEDMEKATSVLLSNGYTLQGEGHGLHRVFRKGSSDLEAHFAFTRKINPVIDRQINEYLSDIIEDAQYISEKYCVCMIPDAFHHGLILLLHMQRHMLTEGLGLRHLCDWAVFINSFADDEFVDLFQERLEKVGLWRYAQALSLSAHVGLGLPYADFMGEDRETAKELLQDFLTSGNFGQGDRGRVNERFFIEYYSDPDARHTRMGSFFRQVNKTIISHWPKAEKSRALLLLGWPYFSMQRLFLRLTGKRTPLTLAKAFKKSSCRKALYDKLHLFETEN